MFVKHLIDIKAHIQSKACLKQMQLCIHCLNCNIYDSNKMLIICIRCYVITDLLYKFALKNYIYTK
jgi:hypothetical protein